MKPKVFIGSSVEGLKVAYSIQQNLTHNAESTVWDQGVFDLSKTSIESLTEILEKMDFGIFVFSPDDITIMRGEEHASIRDNVLFEFGLFIGKLGRERVFFVIPDKGDLKFPSDLFGVTPGKYETERDDGSMQAATGPICSQVKETISKLGALHKIDDLESSSESPEQKNQQNPEWFDHYIDRDYTKAKEELEKVLSKGTSDNKKLDKAWLLYFKVLLNEDNSVDSLVSYALDNCDEKKLTRLIVNMLQWQDLHNRSLELSKELYDNNTNSNEDVITLTKCLYNFDKIDEARTILQSKSPDTEPSIAIALAETYDDKSPESRDILCSSYLNNPNDESLVYKFARVLQEQDFHKEAVYLLDFLTYSYPSNYIYWGYLSNSLLILNLYDKSLTFCQRADQEAESKESWIVQNIGNIFSNKGFYSEAEKYLQKGLKLEEDSVYGHERLAGIKKKKEEEDEEYKKIRKEGRLSIYNMSQQNLDD